MAYGNEPSSSPIINQVSPQKSLDAEVLALAGDLTDVRYTSDEGAPRAVVALDPIPFTTLPAGFKVESLEHLEGRERPRALAASVSVRDAASLVGYVRRFKRGGSVLFVDEKSATVVAELDYHDGPQLPAWRKHRAMLKLEHSPEWQKWSALSGKWQSQEAIALFLEENLRDVVEPAGGELLEVAKTIEASKEAHFRSSTRLEDGSRALAFSEEVSGRAGRTGTLTIPAQIALALRPFLGSATYRVNARFRYRIDTSSGKLVLAWELAEVDRLLDTVFGEYVDGIAHELAASANPGPDGILMLRGVPPAGGL